MQARGCVVVSSSPEILCRVDDHRVVTNRPLAGTRRRGADPEQDLAMERELLADEKERAEHVMLVDLGRNDVGRVAESGSVLVERLMEVERYSHVMHISSTVTGTLRPELDAWDALRAALPAGTVSGAPKVRAMQAIDALEAAKRGPYGGGIGHVGFGGSMDMALGLRTMVIPTADEDGLYSYGGAGAQGQQQPQAGGGGNGGGAQRPPARARREWAVHLQAGAGIVADSVPAAEYEETVNKAAALGRAIDLAEQAFVLSDGP
jgi:anthranilate synthase component I